MKIRLALTDRAFITVPAPQGEGNRISTREVEIIMLPPYCLTRNALGAVKKKGASLRMRLGKIVFFRLSRKQFQLASAREALNPV